MEYHPQTVVPYIPARNAVGGLGVVATVVSATSFTEAVAGGGTDCSGGDHAGL